jgi:hypothetical protein
MAASKNNEKKKVPSKKKTRKQVEKKLETALATLKPLLGEKKFKKRIRKAGKVLTDGLKKDATLNIAVKNPSAVPGVTKPLAAEK